MPPVEKPNYTQIPNAVLDAAADMDDAELRIVIAVCRQTYGWHKPADVISLSQFQRLTGMSRPRVARGLAAALRNGRIERVAVGQGFEYRTSNKSLPVDTPTSNDLLLVTSNDLLPVPPPTSNKSLPELVTPAYPQKKGKETTTKTKKKTVKKEAAAPPSPRPPDALFERLCFIFYKHQNYNALTDKQRGCLNQETKRLREQVGASADDLANWYKAVWRTEWPGKNGSAPQPGQVVAGVTAFLAGTSTVEDTADDRRRRYMPVELRNWQTVSGD